MKLEDLVVGKKVKCKLGFNANPVITIGVIQKHIDRVCIYSDDMKTVVTCYFDGDQLTNIAEA